jgi:hypothetical protein
MPGSFTSDGLREMTDSIEKKEILLSALVMLKELLQRGLTALRSMATPATRLA